MGDLPPNSQPQALDNMTTGSTQDGAPSASTAVPYKSTESNAPFYSQLSGLPQNQLRPDVRALTHSTAHFHGQEETASSLNLSSMATALPAYVSSNDPSQNMNSQTLPRSLPGVSPSSNAYHYGSNQQFTGHASGNVATYPSYGTGYVSGNYQQSFAPSQASHQSQYPSFGPNHARPAGPMTIHNPYQNYPHPSHYMYYPAPYASQGQIMTGYATQGQQAQALFGRRASLTGTSLGAPGQMMEYPPNDGTYPGVRMGQGNYPGEPSLMGASYGAPYVQASGAPHSATVSSIPRGPPRKPKQSGHALWVGNLPPGVTVVALKDHFSRDATKDIESLFLISKSNCAFVNYRTEASCTSAMHRFHDSRFNGVRLVCRLRRSSAPASGIPTGPSAMVENQPHASSRPMTPKQDGVTTGLQERGASSPLHESHDDHRSSADTVNKYFIVKSLTLQDLELSVRNGMWATQSHNEEALNKAFRTIKNVYLIFSANKSGEYFGYARMASPILEDGSHLIGSAPKTGNMTESSDTPISISTPATEWAPRGRIIDDSARGTIFWEAELSEGEEEHPDIEKVETLQKEGENLVTAQSWGKPFKIEWMSTNRLPFYRTRGLRNPWNANREVKIARDGTELEPSVGERLVQMFHRLGPSTTGPHVLPVLGAPDAAPQRPAQ